jgi:(p)ppGpp synthase/HD superfamily hydrolase
MNHDTRIILANNFIEEKHNHLRQTTVSGLYKMQRIHLQEVADLVWASGGTTDEIVAGWLHDTVEDTDVTLREIEELFGKEVARIVEGLTDLEEYKDLSLRERKGKQALRIATLDDKTKRVKLADQTSNVRSLAVDPTTSMTVEECREYIHAAKKIAIACKGVSPLLDGLFEEAFTLGLARYGENAIT